MPTYGAASTAASCREAEHTGGALRWATTPKPCWVLAAVRRNCPRGTRVGRWLTPRARGAHLPGSALGGAELLPWELRESGLPHRRPRDAANPAVCAAGGDDPAPPARRRAGGCGPWAPTAVPGAAGPCTPAALRERRPPPPAPLGGAASPAARPGPSRPPAGGGPGSPGEAAATRRVGGQSPGGGDGARQPPPERPCRGLCLRCHMGRGAGFKRVSAGHAVSGAPQPCPQRQRSARPGMRL